MRVLSHVLRVTARAGKPQERPFATLDLRAPSHGGSHHATDNPVDVRRAEEVQRCADKGWKSALVCVGNMSAGGVSPGTAAYNIALKACMEAGERNHASKLLAVMRASGAVPYDIAGATALEAATKKTTTTRLGGGTTEEEEFVFASASRMVPDLVSSCESSSWGGVVGGSSSCSATTGSSTATAGGGVGAEGSWPSRRPSASAGRGFGSVAGESWRREALLLGGSGDLNFDDDAFVSSSLTSRWGDD